MWILRIDRPSPSQNVLDRMTWHTRRREKAVWKVLIRACPNFLDVPAARGRRRLTIERHAKGTLDTQNLIGGAKGIIDDLVQLRLLVDDTPTLCELSIPLQFRLGKGERRPYTLLVLEDCHEL